MHPSAPSGAPRRYLGDRDPVSAAGGADRAPRPIRGVTIECNGTRIASTSAPICCGWGASTRRRSASVDAHSTKELENLHYAVGPAARLDGEGPGRERPPADEFLKMLWTRPPRRRKTLHSPTSVANATSSVRELRATPIPPLRHRLPALSTHFRRYRPGRYKCKESWVEQLVRTLTADARHLGRRGFRAPAVWKALHLGQFDLGSAIWSLPSSSALRLRSSPLSRLAAASQDCRPIEEAKERGVRVPADADRDQPRHLHRT